MTPAHIITIGPTTINARHLIALRDEGPAKDKRLVALYSAFGNQLQLVVTPAELAALRAAMGAADVPAEPLDDVWCAAVAPQLTEEDAR